MRYLQTIIIIITLSVVFFAKADEKRHCPCEKSKDGPPKLTIFYNGDVGLIGVINTTSSIGLILDYTHNIIKLGNGQTKTAICEDYNTDTIYPDTQVWSSIQPVEKTFGQFFESLTSLQPHLDQVKREGAGSQKPNIPPAVVDEIVRDMTNLVGSFSLELIPYRNMITEELNGPLRLIYKGKGSFDVHEDLGTFVKLNLALADFLHSADDVGSIHTLDPKSLFSDNGGYATFLNFLRQIGDQTDLTKVFHTLIDYSKGKFLRKISDMERAVSSEGMDGLDSTFIDIFLFLEGSDQSSLQKVISSLVSYIPAGVNADALHKKLDIVLDILENQLKKYGSSDENVSYYYGRAKDLSENKLVVNGYNMTDIMNLLFFTSPIDVLHTSLKVCRSLCTDDNMPRMIQAVLGNKIVQQIISTILSGFELENLQGIVLDYPALMEVVLRIPIIGPLIPSILDGGFYLGQDLMEALDHDFEAVVNDLKNGELGEVSLGILKNVIADLRNQVNSVAVSLGLDLGDALSLVNSITGGLPGSLTGDLIGGLTGGLTGGLPDSLTGDLIGGLTGGLTGSLTSGLANVLLAAGEKQGAGKESESKSGFTVNLGVQNRPALGSVLVPSKLSLSVGPRKHDHGKQHGMP